MAAQKWAYQTIVADGPSETILTVNGLPHSATGPLNQLAPFLNHYGQLGWEVVSSDIVRPTDTADGLRDFRIFVMMKHLMH
jgi:hypothetical protein